jgi:hypothetical protein
MDHEQSVQVARVTQPRWELRRSQSFFSNPNRLVSPAMPISASGPDHQQPASEHLGQALPPLPAQDYWSPNICRAHEILQDAYQHAVGLLHREDSDPLRIQIHTDQISHRMVPLLEALHHEVGDINWMTTCAGKFGELLCSLENLVLAASRQ